MKYLRLLHQVGVFIYQYTELLEPLKWLTSTDVTTAVQPEHDAV